MSYFVYFILHVNIDCDWSDLLILEHEIRSDEAKFARY